MIRYIRHILEFSGRHKYRILLSALPLFLKTMLSQMIIFFSYVMIVKLMDKGYEPKDSLIISGGIALTLVFQGFFQYLSDRLQGSAGFVIMAEKRIALGEHLKKMPMGYFSESNVGNISTVLATDMTYLEEHGTAIVAKLMSDMSNMIVSSIFLTVIDYRIGTTYIATVILVLILSRGMVHTSFKEAEIRQEQNRKLASAVIEFVSCIGVIKTFPAAVFAADKADKAFSDSAEDNIHFEKKYSPWALLLGTVCTLGTAGIFFIGFRLFLTGEFDRSFLLGLSLFGLSVFGSVKSLYGQSANLSLAESSLNRIDSLFTQAEMPDTGTEHLPSSSECDIEFQNVSFGYKEKEVLHGISFKARSGEMTALVGESGGGKSTAVSLIARLWDINEGTVRIKGKDIRSIPISELMGEISMVFQRVYLFHDTIYNNIALGSPGASKEDVISAAKKARAHEFIMQLPDGYDTVLDEAGGSLSGGERQRISIARCILKDAPVILLDEATASVDVDNERYIQEAISELCKNKTVIVIAHRLYTIRNADQILVIQDGKIAEHGTYKELINRNGIFKKMALT